MMNKHRVTITLLITVSLYIIAFLQSCKDDDYTVIKKEETDSTDTISNTTKSINEFIYNNMNFYYYWNNFIPQKDPDLEPDSEAFFYSLLNSSIDKWSFITDDYPGLLDYFNGVQLSMGMTFSLYLLKENSSQVIGIVEYVDSGSPADRAGISRGDIFFKVDGQPLNTSNYYDLLTQDVFTTLTFGTIDEVNGTITALTPSISNLIAEELTVDPIHKSDILDLNGTQVGYLMLTAFQQNNEAKLETLFSDFKSHNITELVVDLRYNGGGTITTSKLLASMIGPSLIANKIMIKTSYNSDLENYIKTNYPDDESWFIERFEASDFNLDLTRLFVLTTQNTASASEMLIYCLDPYMDVIQIGSTTHGKYYGSITIPDEKSNWAIQPLIMRSENVDNSIDYTKGLSPDYVADDDYWHELGDPEEEMMAQALSIISGGQIAEMQLKNTKASFISDRYKQISFKENKLKSEPIMIYENSRLKSLISNK